SRCPRRRWASATRRAPRRAARDRVPPPRRSRCGPAPEAWCHVGAGRSAGPAVRARRRRRAGHERRASRGHYAAGRAALRPPPVDMVEAMTEFTLPWLPEGRLVRVEGRGELFARIHRHPDPSAPVVVLLHGWTASSDLQFVSAYEGLAERY